MNKIKSLISLTGKSFAILCLMAFFATTMSAQNNSDKLEWLVNLDEAYAQHEKTGKPILANFTGSDWCGWCKKLTKSVFSKPDFKTWADENVILLELDFPRRKKLSQELTQQNRGLQQAFKVRGYPTIWVFDLGKDENGQYSISALGKTGYTKTVQEFTSGVDQMIARRQNNGE